MTVKFNALTEDWFWLCGYGCWGYNLPTESIAYAEFHSHKCEMSS